VTGGFRDGWGSRRRRIFLPPPDEPDDFGDSTGLDDNHTKIPEPASPPDTATSSSTARWALVRVSGATFTDEQAAAVRKQLADDSYTHVLIVKEGSGTSGYMPFKDACKTVQKVGFPVLFDGRLLRAGNLVVWAAIASRDSHGDDPVDLLQQVLGGGMVGMEEIRVG